MIKVWVEKNVYRDSVTLMHLSDEINKKIKVNDSAVLMGSPTNIERMKKSGFNDPILDHARPSDLCIGIRTEEEDKLNQAENLIRDFLEGKFATVSSKSPQAAKYLKTLSTAKRAHPNANLAVISVPGEYAGQEARFALEKGMHVFLFSDNVPLEEELKLKNYAKSNGLLIMGPDCGTAYIQGVPLGFCNELERGKVGIVAASGTGAQEISSLLGLGGIGISHILGTGGRDLSNEIGGSTSIMALQMLDQDPHTEIIILVSKPPGIESEKKVIRTIQSLTKPVILSFVGRTNSGHHDNQNIYYANSLLNATEIASSLVFPSNKKDFLSFEVFMAQQKEELYAIREMQKPDQKCIRGIFSGGTLTDETAAFLSNHFKQVYAGEGFGNVLPISNWYQSSGHTIIDMGDDRFTKGRPHPMIDPGTRIERLAQESQDPSVSAIIMDVILGYNADPDPATKLAPAIKKSMEKAEESGRKIAMIIHICGTHGDIQNLERQIELFKDKGCLVYTSNLEAAMAASFFGKDN